MSGVHEVESDIESEDTNERYGETGGADEECVCYHVGNTTRCNVLMQ